MRAVWRPDHVEAVQDAVREAVASRLTLDIAGRGSRRALGRPFEADVTLDLSGLSGVVDYQPEELVLTILPGTSLAEVQGLLADNGQALGFEPPDFSDLWGVGGGSIGGAMISGFGGPAQLTAGGPRDHCLGVKVVNGTGELWASGGRVVKNVTGFDMPKLICGSFGLLGAVVELTVKTTPSRGEQRTLVLGGLDEFQAAAVMTAAMASSANVAAAAHLPADAARLCRAETIAGLGGPATLLRLDGMPLSVEARLQALAASLPVQGASTSLDHRASRLAWDDIADARLLADDRESVIWRISVPPASGPALGGRLARELDGRCFYDWAGGAIWLQLPAALHPQLLDIRPAVRAIVGPDAHATILRAPDALRTAIAPFHPPAPAVAALNRRLKHRFDPYGLFNPGRMYGDM